MVTTNVIFSHKASKDRHARAYLEIRITYNRKSYYINTGIKVARDEWKFGSVVDRADSQELNERLAILVARAEDAINYYLKTQQPIDIEHVRNRVNMIKEDSHDAPFLDWLNDQIKKCTLSERTKKSYRTLLARLCEYDKLRKWQDINTEALLDFNSWLHNRPIPMSENQRLAGMEARYMTDAGVFNYHKSLKKMLYLAVKLGKIDNNPYARLQGEFPKGDHENVEYLTDDEIERIMDVSLPVGSYYCTARDMFVFQMFTGMAYVDMQRFDIANYKCVDGRWIAVSERVKSGVAFIGHLLPPVVEVLERYGMKVPKMSNQAYNRALKEVGRMAGVQTPLHSHLARHTFATYMLSHGVKVENLQRMMGHKHITMTQRYAKTLAQSVHDEFDMIEKKMKNGKLR